MSKPSPPAPGATPGDAFDRLVEIMQILRSPEGCPWDREQTVESLRPFVIEEAYEVVDAIDRGDRLALRDELGDFVLEAVFIAQVADEAGEFSIAQSLHQISEKLVRRHPHVFTTDGDDDAQEVRTSADVKRRWEQIKAEEQEAAGQTPSLLGGIPDALPSLLRAYRIGRRTATVGFDWERPDDVVGKVEEELAEVLEAKTADDPEALAEEVGDLLFAVANLARHLQIDPEEALRRANRKFSARFTRLEQAFRDRGVELRDAALDDMEAEWQRLKSAP